MTKVLAIDYGTKRTGIAVTDDTQIFAFGVTTVATKDIFPFLVGYLAEHKIVEVVVGEPKRLNNTPTHATPHVEGFVRKLQREFPKLSIHRMDERFTSGMARASILASGIKKKGRENKSLVDMVSATIILQSWLEQKSHNR